MTDCADRLAIARKEWTFERTEENKLLPSDCCEKTVDVRGRVDCLYTQSHAAMQTGYPGGVARSHRAWSAMKDFTRVYNRGASCLAQPISRRTSGLWCSCGVTGGQNSMDVDVRSFSPTNQSRPVPAAPKSLARIPQIPQMVRRRLLVDVVGRDRSRLPCIHLAAMRASSGHRPDRSAATGVESLASCSEHLQWHHVGSKKYSTARQPGATCTGHVRGSGVRKRLVERRRAVGGRKTSARRCV